MTGKFAAVAALAITLAVSAGFLAIANGFPFGEASNSNSFFDQMTPAGAADLVLPDTGTPADQSTAASEAGCPQGQQAGADGVCATAVAEQGEQDEHQGEHENHEGGNGEHESGHEAED